MFVVRRLNENPILGPDSRNAWETYAAFNGCPIKTGSTTHLLYRAQSVPEKFGNDTFSLSTIGRAQSTDGIHFTDRRELIVPEHEWERYGCEDPRVTFFEGKYYIFYTALSAYPFRAEGIKIAVAISKDLKTIDDKHLVTPFNAKAMALFPERINGKVTVILTAHTDMPPSHIAIAQFDSIENMLSEDYWHKWETDLVDHTVHLRRTMRDPNEQVEVGAPPIKTKAGWLLVYSHIQKYQSDSKIFGIEAILLDRNDPRHVIGRTRGPLLVPEEMYEKTGTVPNTIFPSGALIRDNTLEIHYSGTDTTCNIAYVDLDEILDGMRLNYHGPFIRYKENPILKPIKEHAWESQTVFNPAAIDLGGKIHIIYRAMSDDNTSVMGYASSKDGLSVSERLDEPMYVPREQFEEKGIPGGNSGCEDPRVVKIDDKIYMHYTAYNGITPPAVAVSSINESDFLSKKWNWSTPSLATPLGVDDKDACILSEQINGKYVLFHRVNSMICVDYVSSITNLNPDELKNIGILRARPGMWDSRKVGLSTPPIKTKAGWLMLYHGVSDHGTYRVGAVLLKLDDPQSVLARTTDHIFEPVEEYEKVGIVPNVVFPCGVVLRKGTLYMYYGGADQVVGVATMKLQDLLDALTKGL